MEISFCPVCDSICLECDEIDHDQENSICCDICQLWYHWGCEGITDERVFQNLIQIIPYASFLETCSVNVRVVLSREVE